MTACPDGAVLMTDMRPDASIVGSDDPILVTGATGFMGPALVASLLKHGLRNVRTFARPSSDVGRLQAVANGHGEDARIELLRGNLLSLDDCRRAVQDVAVIFHLANAGGKSYPDAIMNSVVTTRNLLEAGRHQPSLRRFVNISSFAVYANTERRCLDESSSVGGVGRDAYAFAKASQDELVTEYGHRFGIPYVIVRPGYVVGPGKEAITGRVGVDMFGVFLHLGGSNRIPFTYVDNCSDAIVLAGITPGVEGEVFNVVDDDLPSSRQFLRQYKRKVRRVRSIYVPRPVSYMLCRLWEKYSVWSEGQLPPVFNRQRWNAEWKKTRYSNEKLKIKLGWRPEVSMQEGLDRYFASCREKQGA
jgi:nucleoside-diphosphate-sugar epimerase